MCKLNSHTYINDGFRPICPAKSDSTDIENRINILKKWTFLRKKKLSVKEIEKILGIAKSTYYRYRKAYKENGVMGLEKQSTRPKNVRKGNISQELISKVLEIRKDNPTYGKFKINIILKRDYGIKTSESTVGRVISMLKNSGEISESISSRRKTKRTRKFNSHAQKWDYKMKANKAGQLVQIDHMSVTKNGVSIKHFQAWDPITKVIIADAKSNATSAAAAKFLDKVIAEMPFEISSIQVDGGSEFMKYFEDKCEELDIDLFVLPPRRPQYNGGVERGNRIFREEFYKQKSYAKSIKQIRQELSISIDKYNKYRPHFNLNGMTPFEYNQKLIEAA